MSDVRQEPEGSGSTLLDKLLEILDCFSAQEPLLSLKEIGRLSGITNSSLYRYVNMLVSGGLLDRDEQTGKYGIGLRMAEFAGVGLARLEVRRHGQYELDMLAQAVRYNTNLAVLYEGDSFHICYSLQTEVGRLYTVIGRRTPAHVTALGKMIYAHMPRAEVHALIEKYGWRARTPYSIDNFDALDQALDEARVNGYAVDRNENSLDGWCVAAPVFQRGGQIAAAMSVSGATEDIRRDFEAIVPRLKESALRLSYKLGYYAP